MRLALVHGSKLGVKLDLRDRIRAGATADDVVPPEYLIRLRLRSGLGERDQAEVVCGSLDPGRRWSANALLRGVGHAASVAEATWPAVGYAARRVYR